MKKIIYSLSPEIKKYLQGHPLDEEFEGVIADMTLANFNNLEVESFVSKVFDSQVPTASKMNNNHHYPKNDDQPSFGGKGNNGGFPGNNGGSPNNNQGYPNNNQGYPNNNQGYPNNNPYPNNQGYPGNAPYPDQGFNQGNPGFSSPNANFRAPSNLPMNSGHPSPQPVNNQPQKKNIQEMNDNEFEGALDDFIKGLKDI